MTKVGFTFSTAVEQLPNRVLWVFSLCCITRPLWPHSPRTLTVKWDNDCDVKSSRCQLWALEGIFNHIKWTVKEPRTLLYFCQKYLNRLGVDPVITICCPFLSNAAANYWAVTMGNCQNNNTVTHQMNLNTFTSGTSSQTFKENRASCNHHRIW